VIAIIPEQVIGMPRNTDRHRPESPRNRQSELTAVRSLSRSRRKHNFTGGICSSPKHEGQLRKCVVTTVCRRGQHLVLMTLERGLESPNNARRYIKYFILDI
jgi:hypothetical protein